MNSRGWRRFSVWAAAFAGLGFTVAIGFRFGWWQALSDDPVEKPWDWVERISWLVAILGLVAALSGPRPGGSPRPVGEQTAQSAIRRLVSVDDCRPEHVGIHATTEYPTSTASAGKLVPYVSRDHDENLRNQLREVKVAGGLVCLVGGSATGKSRSTYEAVRELYRGWNILIPDDAEDLRRVAHDIPGNTVVWLDDSPAPRFLRPGGLTRTELLELTGRDFSRGPVIGIIILWPQGHQLLTRAPDARAVFDSAADDPWRNAREAFGLVRLSPVRCSADFSDEERTRADAVVESTSDLQLARALEDEQFGVTQNLAGAPQLVAHWQDGSQINPFGAALITAAIDIRGLGVLAPLTERVLSAVTPSYFSDRGSATAPADWLSDALAYATRYLRGDVQALYPVPGEHVGTVEGYEIADYLRHHGSRLRHYVGIPDAVWEVLPPLVTEDDDLVALAKSAEIRGRGEVALACYRRAARTYPEVRADLVNLLGEEGRFQEAIDEARTMTFEGSPRGPFELARMAVEAGLADEAVVELQALARGGNPYANEELLGVLTESGRVDDLARLADTGDRQARLFHAIALARRGDFDDALGELRELAQNGDHFVLLTLAAVLVQSGNAHEAIDLLREIPVSFGQFQAGFMLIRTLVSEGRIDEARTEAMRIASDGNDVARSVFAQEMADRGLIDEAISELQALDPRTRPFRLLPQLLAEQDRVEELRELAVDDVSARHIYMDHLITWDAADKVRELADSGDAVAWFSMIRDLVRVGRIDEAIAELRKKSRKGDPGAQLQLAGLLAVAGRTEELKDMAAAGDMFAFLALKGAPLWVENVPPEQTNQPFDEVG